MSCLPNAVPGAANVWLRQNASAFFRSPSPGVQAGIRTLEPDVVITDLIMPEQEGIETIMMIRHERPEVGVIAISGGARSRNFDYLRMAGSLGAAEVIRKPFEAEELLSRLDRLRTASPTGTSG